MREVDERMSDTQRAPQMPEVHSVPARTDDSHTGNAEFLRAANEDDDGYDPYSDRRPAPEPLFERDPWG